MGGWVNAGPMITSVVCFRSFCCWIALLQGDVLALSLVDGSGSPGTGYPRNRVFVVVGRTWKSLNIPSRRVVYIDRLVVLFGLLQVTLTESLAGARLVGDGVCVCAW